MTKESSCYKLNKFKFLFWEFDTSYFDHDWYYLNKEERKCVKCGIVEMYFGTGDYNYEDWRPKLIP